MLRNFGMLRLKIDNNKTQWKLKCNFGANLGRVSLKLLNPDLNESETLNPVLL